MDEIQWLQRWYRSQCDDEWEHAYGIKIDTLDNPGWSVAIDIKGTTVENRPFQAVKIERTETDWIHCRVDKSRWKGFGGPNNLIEIVSVFRNWVEG